jgi:hypothetical protein
MQATYEEVTTSSRFFDKPWTRSYNQRFRQGDQTVN